MLGSRQLQRVWIGWSVDKKADEQELRVETVNGLEIYTMDFVLCTQHSEAIGNFTEVEE